MYADAEVEADATRRERLRRAQPWPYCVAAPAAFSRADLVPYKDMLGRVLGQSEPMIESVEIEMKENIYGFQGNQKVPYLKINVTDPKFMPRVRVAIENGRVNYKAMWKGVEGGIMTFDNIQYVLRFMVDTKVTI